MMITDKSSEVDVLKKHLTQQPVNVAELADDLGIVYIEQPLEPGQSGKFSFDGQKYTITVDSDESPQRRRFSAAHEIGHFFLHRDLLGEGVHMDRLFAPDENPSYPFQRKHETQANAFAADLLMPASVIHGLCQNGECDPKALAERFDVSTIAMKWRLFNLDLAEKPE